MCQVLKYFKQFQSNVTQQIINTNKSVRKKSYGYLLNVEPSNLVFLKTFNTEFVTYTIITYTDQNVRLLEIENKVTLTLLTNKQK